MSATPHVFVRSCIFTLVCYGSLLSIDNAHFYRAPFFRGEARMDHDLMTTAEVWLGGGIRRTSRNSCREDVCLLDIYGPHNLLSLGCGVDKNPDDHLDTILNDVAVLGSKNDFGEVSFSGRFSIGEIAFNVIQNIKRGFFVQGYLPVRRLKISDIFLHDRSPHRTDPEPNQATPEWSTFLKHFDEILCRYGLSKGTFDESGIGDLSVLLGWTHNYQDNKYLDYADTTFRVGVLFPTSADRNLSHVFALPLGYDGSWGLPIRFDMGLGLFEWLTFGVQVGAISFFRHTKTVRMKTSSCQNGFIKLACGKVKIDQGTIWDLGGYLKSDHLFGNHSVYVGYSYTHQGDTHLTPCDALAFDERTINSDPMLRDWTMHTLHFLLEFDFAKEGNTLHPRISFFYNLIVGGTRIFKTPLAGGALGADITWRY